MFLKSDDSKLWLTWFASHIATFMAAVVVIVLDNTVQIHCLEFEKRAALLWHLICSGYLTCGWQFGRQSDNSVVGVHPFLPLSFMTPFKSTTHCHSVHNLHTCFISDMFQMVRESRRVAFYSLFQWILPGRSQPKNVLQQVCSDKMQLIKIATILFVLWIIGCQEHETFKN